MPILPKFTEYLNTPFGPKTNSICVVDHFKFQKFLSISLTFVFQNFQANIKSTQNTKKKHTQSGRFGILIIFTEVTMTENRKKM